MWWRRSSKRTCRSESLLVDITLASWLETSSDTGVGKRKASATGLPWRSAVGYTLILVCGDRSISKVNWAGTSEEKEGVSQPQDGATARGAPSAPVDPGCQEASARHCLPLRKAICVEGDHKSLTRCQHVEGGFLKPLPGSPVRVPCPHFQETRPKASHHWQPQQFPEEKRCCSCVVRGSLRKGLGANARGSAEGPLLTGSCKSQARCLSPGSSPLPGRNPNQEPGMQDTLQNTDYGSEGAKTTLQAPAPSA